MFNFKVNIKGLNKGKQETIDKARRVLMKSMIKMEELAVNNSPFDRGDLRLGISVFPEVLANRYVLKSSAPQSQALEFGSRPFYAPIKPLKAWAARKLGDENIAYAVRAKIAKEGITAQPFMRPALHEVKSFWVEEFAKKEFNE